MAWLFDGRHIRQRSASSAVAAAFLIGSAMPALAQTGGGSSSMPGTAGIHTGTVVQETIDGKKARDTSTAGTAGTAYPGTTAAPMGRDLLDTDPVTDGAPRLARGDPGQPAGTVSPNDGDAGD